MGSRNRSGGRGQLSRALPLLLLLVGFIIELLTILRLNSGHFTYTLDDPYIHLALAERLQQGHYGINHGEASAPSSSIIWPFLLAPVAGLAGFELLPLMMGLVAAAATVGIYRRVLDVAFADAELYPKPALVSAILMSLILMTNLIGLPFTGMEHSLQVMLVALIVLGLVQEASSGRVSGWLPWVVAVAPVVRYENLAVTGAAVLYLGIRGRRRVALLSAIGTLIPIAIHSLFLLHLGLKPLPASVLLKAPVFSSNVLGGLLSNLRTTLRDPTGVLLVVAAAWMLCLVLFSFRPAADRVLAGSVTAAIGFHALAGRYGAYHRWEIYIVAVAVLTLLYLERRAIIKAMTRRPAAIGAAVCALWCLTLGGRYIFGLTTIPVAANNIHEQQYQMHRFVVEFERRPVAINDLGYVAFRNSHYVLDLLGLGSPGATEHPEGDARRAWMERAAVEHRIETVMLYDEWFDHLPESWRRVGRLHLSRPRIAPAWGTVSFYATNESVHPAVRDRVRAFAATLPSRVKFEFER